MNRQIFVFVGLLVVLAGTWVGVLVKIKQDTKPAQATPYSRIHRPHTAAEKLREAEEEKASEEYGDDRDSAQDNRGYYDQ